MDTISLPGVENDPSAFVRRAAGRSEAPSTRLPLLFTTPAARASPPGAPRQQRGIKVSSRHPRGGLT
ncbi:hypothetical protein E2C01_017012 [Portunus trituberculatus]|uniref:Uncharacterized protein n=1 Tax=Portunus trituberculatus TaxID=210409 RepID=A0A5B7DRT6_PORTR|nr:hypothetical protein [Portunus trituberculatus]